MPSPTAAPPREEPGPQGDLSKIIRDGRIGIVVTNGSFGDAVGDVTLIAERNGGFILSSSTERNGPERSYFGSRQTDSIVRAADPGPRDPRPVRAGHRRGRDR